MSAVGIVLATPGDVSESRERLVYDQPTVMWRMRRDDGLSSHVLIDPHSDGATVVWFVNDRPVGFREFDDWSAALRCSDQMQAQNWAVGWRMVPEYDERRVSLHRVIRNRTDLDQQ